MPDVGVNSIRDASAHRFDASAHRFPKRERHARTPDSVLSDKRLNLETKAVYSAMARHAFKGGLVYIGQRRLADYLGVHQTTVSRNIVELIKHEHIEVTVSGDGKRSGYRLKSSIFLPREKRQAPVKRRSAVVEAAANWARIQEEKNSA